MGLTTRITSYNVCYTKLLRDFYTRILGMKLLRQHENRITSYNVCYTKLLRALLQRIHEAGIAGLGGAGFPTDIKLKGAQGRVELLIINGCECA